MGLPVLVRVWLRATQSSHVAHDAPSIWVSCVWSNYEARYYLVFLFMLFQPRVRDRSKVEFILAGQVRRMGCYYKAKLCVM